MTTIDKAAIVLEFCPNYDAIISFDYQVDDIISKQIIDYYRDYVFNFDHNNKEDLLFIKNFDQIIYEYIDSGKCFKEVQNHFRKNPSCYNDLINSFIRLNNEYSDRLVREITTTKWV